MDSSQLKQMALCVAVLTLVGCTTASKSTEPVNLQSREVVAQIGFAAPGDKVQLPVNNSLGMDSVVVDRTYIAASGRECRRLRAIDGTPIQRVACERADGVWVLARDLRPISSTEPTGVATKLSMGSASSIQPLVPSAGSLLLLNDDGTVSRATTEQNNQEPIVIGAAEAEIDLSKLDMVGDAISELPQDTTTLETIETVKRTVNLNETLWSFAKRTTGNALNWNTIAEINGITDAKTLTTGTQLLIPAELVSQGG